MTQPVTTFDFDAVDPTASDPTASTYPLAQWHNGNPALEPAAGLAHTGGIFLPQKYLEEDTRLPAWKPVKVRFRSGKTEAGLGTQAAVLAVIRTRFQWFVRRGKVTHYYPRVGWVAGSGMRGHLQVLAAVYGYPAPISITFKGKASQCLEALLKEFTARVVSEGYKNAPPGKQLPRYAFWLKVVPGEAVLAGQEGQQSAITPPTLCLPKEITPEYLGKVYVGRDNLIKFQRWFHEAALWASAWDSPGAEEADSQDESDDPSE
jgi:hypothetical protein